MNLTTPETALKQTAASAAEKGVPAHPTRLLNWNFVLLWLGQTISQTGSFVYAIAMTLWLKHTTDSASVIGIIMMVATIPGVIISGITGTFADRHSRRKIIIYCDLLRGILVLSLAGLLYLTPQATGTIIIWLLVVAVGMSVTTSFFRPAIAASIPDLVPMDRVAGANSLRQLMAQLSMLVGRATGGVLFRLWGAPLLALINGLSFLAAALSEAFIEIPQNIPEKSGDGKKQLRAFREDIVEGVRYVWRASGLRNLFFFSAIFNFFAAPIIVLLPFYVLDFLKLTEDWYGFLLAAYGVGLLVGSLLAGFIRIGGRVRGRIMIIFAIINSLTIGLLGFANDPLAALILALLIGAMGAFNGINVATILHISTPSEIRGRVFGLDNTLSGSLAPLGMGLGSLVYDLTGKDIALIFGGCSIIMALLSIAVSLNREFRAFLAYQREERVPQRAEEDGVALERGAEFSEYGYQLIQQVKGQLFHLAQQIPTAISVYRLPDEVAVTLSRLAGSEAIYEGLTSDFVSLDKLIKRLTCEHHPYIIILSIYRPHSSDQVESSGLIYIEGDSVEAICLSETGLITNPNALSQLLSKCRERLAAFNVYRVKESAQLAGDQGEVERRVNEPVP
jgi:MFS family permease